jgi:hypothetical protein
MQQYFFQFGFHATLYNDKNLKYLYKDKTVEQIWQCDNHFA